MKLSFHSGVQHWTAAFSRALVLSLFAFCLSNCSRTPELTVLQGPTMGSTWHLQAVKPPADLRDFIQAKLIAQEAILSHWRADSPLSQFNTSQGTDWFAVPKELVAVVKLAKEIADQTEGALDITIGPLIDLWGFGAHRRGQTVPTLEAIAEAKELCGWENLEWRDEPPALRKKIPGLRINVAAVTEGFVMDELVGLLRQRGLTDFLFEIGGEVAAIGHAPDGQAWQVGIQAPNGDQGDAMQALPLSDLCVSTSGTYRHRFEAGGKTYTHLLDPRSGRPVAHRLRSASVIHARCALADGYATALMVLGPIRGREVAQRLGLQVVWVMEEE
jgi:thiamine biosynthesis lipoprotein